MFYDLVKEEFFSIEEEGHDSARKLAIEIYLNSLGYYSDKKDMFFQIINKLFVQPDVHFGCYSTKKGDLLAMAALSGDERLVDSLLERGFDPSFKYRIEEEDMFENSLYNILTVAIGDRNIEVAEFDRILPLLDKFLERSNVKDIIDDKLGFDIVGQAVWLFHEIDDSVNSVNRKILERFIDQIIYHSGAKISLGKEMLESDIKHFSDDIDVVPDRVKALVILNRQIDNPFQVQDLEQIKKITSSAVVNQKIFDIAICEVNKVKLGVGDEIVLWQACEFLPNTQKLIVKRSFEADQIRSI